MWWARRRMHDTLTCVYPVSIALLSFVECTKQAALSAAEAGVKEADGASAAVLGSRATAGGDRDGDSGDDTDDGMRLRPAPARASSASGVKEEDIRSLESTAKTAKTAGSTVPQVRCNAVQRGVWQSGGTGSVLRGAHFCLIAARWMRSPFTPLFLFFSHRTG